MLIKIISKKREKRYVNSYLVKNLFKEVNIMDFLDRNISAISISEDLEFIGLNISKKTYSIIKVYLGLLLPLIYILINLVTVNNVNYLLLGLYSFIIFLIIFVMADIVLKIIVKFIQLELRFEFINFLGAWSRNIELGSNFISSLERSSELVKGNLNRLIKSMVKDINASAHVDVAIIKFGQACRDKEIKDFCESMASDIRDGADITKYIVDTNKRIQNDKVNIINANTRNWKIALSTLTGILIFFTFAIYLMLYTIQSLSAA